VEEGSPDDVPGQVFHGGLILGEYTLAAEDLESGMTPVGEHDDQVSGNSPLGQEHLGDPVPEDRLQLFQAQRRSDPEHALPVKASVRHQDMAVGIESEEIAKSLDGDDGAGVIVKARPDPSRKDDRDLPT
jgi:hypothetical protein